MSYEKWSLGYWVLKQIVRFAEFIIYKKVIINGKDKIPKDKPILFAPNHQNALSDPMAVLLYTPYQPVWLARADIFKNKTAARILRFMKIMPVYRIRDGKDQLAKNDETFDNSIRVLKSNGALALFPEAAHSGKRQMLAHKKAVPRIVFMAEERSDENINIQIIPTGIYYSSYWKFNRTVIVNFGDPVPVNNYLEEYKTNPNSATLALRDKLYEGIDDQTINIHSKVYYEEFELVREYYGRTYLERKHQKYSPTHQFWTDRELTHKLDTLEKDSPELTLEIISLAKQYQQLLKKHGLRSWLLTRKRSILLEQIVSRLILVLGLPIFIYGFVFNAIPFFAIDTVVRKKIKDVAFWSTFALVLGIIVFPIVYLLELLAVSSFIPGIWLKIAFVLTLPFIGKLAFKWYVLFLKTWGRGKLIALKLFNKKEYAELVEIKNKLFSVLDNKIEI